MATIARKYRPLFLWAGVTLWVIGMVGTLGLALTYGIVGYFMLLAQTAGFVLLYGVAMLAHRLDREHVSTFEVRLRRRLFRPKRRSAGKPTAE